MNVFYCDEDPTTAAKVLPNKLVVKMPTETGQLLANHFTKEQLENAPRTKTGKVRGHFNPKHGSSIWTNDSSANYLWVLNHGFALCNEYTRRYNKTHFVVEFLQWVKENINLNKFTNNYFTTVYQAMPEQYQIADDPVTAYRNYLVAEKSYYAKWFSQKDLPKWWPYKKEFIVT